MGSTGRGIYGRSREGAASQETFGIVGATPYRGKIPEDSGLEPVGSNKITLKMKADNGDSILFQFKLSKDNKLMTIIGYKDGIPQVKCKVAVDSGQPSLDAVMKNGTAAQKSQAVKMKDLFSKSPDMKESNLGGIANKLLAAKKKKEGSR